MTRIKVGLPEQAQTITATQGSSSDTEVGAVPVGNPAYVNPTTSAPRVWATRTAVPEADGGYTAGVCWNSNTPYPMRAGVHYRFGPTQEVSGSRFWSYVFPSGDTIMDWSFAVGGKVMLWGHDNGVFSYRGQRTIAGWATRPVAVVTGSTGYMTGNTYRYSFPSWCRPKTANGVTLERSDIWFGVSGIFADGQESEIRWTAAPVDTGDRSGGGGTTTTKSGDIAGSYTTTGVPNRPATISATPVAADSYAFDLLWTTASGVLGYRIHYSWVDPTTLPASNYIELAPAGPGEPELRDGDMFVLATPEITSMDYRWYSGRVHDAAEADAYLPRAGAFRMNPQNKPNLGQTWQKIAHGARPFADSAKHFERLTVDTVQGFTVSSVMTLSLNYYAGSVSQDYYYIPQIGDALRVKIRLRASEAVSVKFAMLTPNRSGHYASGGLQTLNLTTEWQTFDLQETVTTDLGTLAGTLWWGIWIDNGMGLPASFHVDCDLCQFTYPENDRVPFVPQSALDVVEPDMEVRDHGTVKTYPNWGEMDAALDVPGTGVRGQISSQLFDRKACGGGCQLQFDCLAFTPEEIDEWISYMANPNDARRISQGQALPWTKEFGKITFEPMNEAWNTISEFWTLNFALVDGVTAAGYTGGYTFGAYCAWLWNRITSSPYYVPGEWDMLLGGWANNVGNWNVDMMAGFVANCNSDFLPISAIAGYIGGWEVTNAMSQNTEDTYENILGSPQAANLIAQAQLTSMRDEYPGLRFANYETGPGFQLSGLNGASVTKTQSIQQETANNSRAMGTATLSSFCYGVSVTPMVTQNYFIHEVGNAWGFMKEPFYGGGVKGHYEPIRILHRELGRCRARVMNTTAMGQRLAYKSNGDPTTINKAAVFAFQSLDVPGRWAIVACNFTTDEDLAPVVKLPAMGSKTARLLYDGRDFRHHDRYNPGYRWMQTTVKVDGAGQTGTRLDATDWAKPAEVGKTLTIDGVVGTYTISAVEGFRTDTGYFTVSPAISVAPADGAAITVTSGTTKGSLTVKGAGQTGTEIYVTGGTLTNNGQFTIAGDGTTYTVSSQRHFNATSGRVTLTTPLDSSPADNAVVNYEDADYDNRRWADTTSVAFDFSIGAAGAPFDASTITFDASVGLPAAGIAPGNFAILFLDTPA